MRYRFKLGCGTEFTDVYIFICINAFDEREKERESEKKREGGGFEVNEGREKKRV